MNAAAGSDESGSSRRLIIDPGFHTARIWSLSADRDQTIAATAGDDRTVRIWSIADGALRRTIRLPIGDDDLGKVYAVGLDPSGRLLAIGGALRGAHAGETRVFVMDAETGAVLHRLDGLPDICRELAFSPDGRLLAGVIANFGVHIWDVAAGFVPVRWHQLPRTGHATLAWSPDGRLAVTGRADLVDFCSLMLFEPDGELATAVRIAGDFHCLAFSADGSRLIVAGREEPTLEVFATGDFDRELSTRFAGMQGQGFVCAAWQGATNSIILGGNLGFADDRGSCVPLFCFDPAKPGQFGDVGRMDNAIMGVAALADGGHLVATTGPSLERLDSHGAVIWSHGPAFADMRGQDRRFSVSANGEQVRFGIEEWARSPVQFDLGTLALTPDAEGTELEERPPPVLPIDVQRLVAEETARGAWGYQEIFRCAVPHPDGKRLIIGTAWNIYAYEVFGADQYRPVWRRVGPDSIWAAEISADGRLAIVALQDGSIRWYRMEDGEPLLALLARSDKSNWVCWTPEGTYSATVGARSMLRWHLNDKNDPWGAMGSSVRVDEIPELLRPDVLPLVIRELDEIRALGLAERQKMRAAVRRHTGRDPAARLHLVTVGAGRFSRDDAKGLTLKFAEKDAQDIYAALKGSQNALYAAVLPQLLDGIVQEASWNNMLQSLTAVRGQVAESDGRDLVVVHFSGHGAVLDNRLFLLPAEVDPRTEVTFKQSAIRFDALRDEFLAMANHGRVLVLLDACRSGSATLDGRAGPFDASMARAALSAPNVSILASSGAAEPSWEDPVWQNGAFTEVFLEALGVRSDRDKDGVIDLEDIIAWMDRRLPELTGGRQRLQTETRFTGSLFAAGL